MLHIRNILNKNVAASGLSKGVESSQIVEEADKIVKDLFTPEIAAKMQVSHVKDKTLYITCDSTPIAQELSFYIQQIIDDLNEKVGKGRIERITTNIG